MRRAACWMLRVILATTFAAIVALCSSEPARAQDRYEWTTEQKSVAAAALALHAVDWLQTREIARNPDRWHERGPIARAFIGAHPTVGQVDAYMLGSAVALIGIAHFIPEYRVPFLGGWAVATLGVVIHNHGIGIRISGGF